MAEPEQADVAAQRRETGQRNLLAAVAQWDQISRAERAILPAVAHALALIAGQDVVLTGKKTDNTTGLIAAVEYRTGDGQAHLLVLDRTPAGGAAAAPLN